LAHAATRPLAGLWGRATLTDWRPRFDWTAVEDCLVWTPLTMYPNAQLAAEVLRAGFIVKDGAGPEIIAALHAVLRGRT
jgi:hypothetical protein